MTIKERIKKLANSEGLSIPKLEEELGFGGGTISRWDKSAPSADKLSKIADRFDVTVDYLLGREMTGSDSIADNSLLTKKVFLSDTDLIFIYGHFQKQLAKINKISASHDCPFDDDTISSQKAPFESVLRHLRSQFPYLAKMDKFF